MLMSLNKTDALHLMSAQYLGHSTERSRDEVMDLIITTTAWSAVIRHVHLPSGVKLNIDRRRRR